MQRLKQHFLTSKGNMHIKITETWRNCFECSQPLDLNTKAPNGKQFVKAICQLFKCFCVEHIRVFHSVCIREYELSGKISFLIFYQCTKIKNSRFGVQNVIHVRFSKCNVRANINLTYSSLETTGIPVSNNYSKS